MTKYEDDRDLVRACIDGDREARETFSNRFAELIYRFVDDDSVLVGDVEAGDFYLFVTEDDLIYRRLRTYEGRASLKSYLLSYVLPDLLKQLFAQRRRPECVGGDTVDRCHGDAADTEGVAGVGAEIRRAIDDGRGHADDVFAGLTRDKALLLKLWHIEDFELDTDDLRLLSRESGRSIAEVVHGVERARRLVRKRERLQREKVEQAASAAGWILQYQREIRRIDAELSTVPAGTTRSARLGEKRDDLARKESWRRSQQLKALREADHTVVTLGIDEIAELFGTRSGTISSRISRLCKAVRENRPEIARSVG